MLTVCYAAKGGQGTTTVTAALAIIGAGPSLVVIDAGGDLPAALGVTQEPAAAGLADVLAEGGVLDAAAVVELARGAGAVPQVVPAGGPLDDVPVHRWAALARVLRDDERHWLVDAGTTPAAELAAYAQRALLVITNCYLGLRRARLHPIEPTGVVYVEDPERPLGRRDVADVVDAPVVATVRRDPRVGRASDAGLLAAGLPDSLREPLASMVGQGL